jgi:hypothetical protein
MTPVAFEGQTDVIAKHQPQYRPIPAHLSEDGVMTCCWALTWRERFTLLIRGQLWHQVMTFNKPLQPQSLTAAKPHLDRGVRIR